MNPDHARFAEWDAAFVLGALAPAERRAYEEHVESCPLCRQSVAELTSIPGLLARLSPERASAVLDEPAAAAAAAGAPRPELFGAVREEGRRRRIRRARLRLAMAAAAVAVVLTAVLVPIAFLPPLDAETIAFEAVADVPLSATATLTPVGWGTRIELDCGYGEAGASGDSDGAWPYALYVVDRTGHRREISSWRASPGKSAQLSAGTALGIDDIASLEIRALGTGDVLMLGVADSARR